MEENKIYYTLRYIHSDTHHKAGEKLVAANREVRIGQQEDCDALFDNGTDFADELFAVIRQSSDACSWNLIVCSEHVNTMVNGTRIEMIHPLSDGDHITFSATSQELVFNLHNDAVYNPSSGTLHVDAPISRRLIAALVALPLLLFAVGGIYFHNLSTKEDAINSAINSAKASVYQLSVNAVYYEMITSTDTIRIDSMSYEGKGICGSAFLTSDSLIVTARHCIEPWLNDGEVMHTDNPLKINSKATRWALMAETYNQTHSSDTTYRVVSLFSLYSGDKGERLEGRYRSNQFYYDSSRDDIIEKGDFAHEYYWRSLLRRHSQKDMMLGDIATIHTNKAGSIILADSTKMKELVVERNRLDFIGYPSYESEGQEASSGEVRRYLNNSSDDCMIAHNGKLTHGYSGGPALIVKGSDVYAVGVISVTENVGDRMYSVPVTEIKRGGSKQ